jgi:hypothetical protein
MNIVLALLSPLAGVASFATTTAALSLLVR